MNLFQKYAKHWKLWDGQITRAHFGMTSQRVGDSIPIRQPSSTVLSNRYRYSDKMVRCEIAHSVVPKVTLCHSSARIRIYRFLQLDNYLDSWSCLLLSEMKKSRKANNWKVPVSYSPLDARPDHSVFMRQPASERLAPPPRPFQAPSTASFAYPGSMPAKSPRASPEEASPGAYRKGMPNPSLSRIWLAHNNLRYSRNLVELA